MKVMNTKISTAKWMNEWVRWGCEKRNTENEIKASEKMKVGMEISLISFERNGIMEVYTSYA